jgi:phage recombination protein Bet
MSTVQKQLVGSLALCDDESKTTAMVPRARDQEFTRDKVDLIKRTIAVGASDDELELFLYTARKTGLDPLARQIYAIKRAGKMTIQTGIDGYRLIADRTGQLAGISDYVFDSEDGKFPNRASVTVKKMVDGHIAEFTATARWTEYSQLQSPMWQKMPYLMLGKCSEALALRKAFPADLSGVYTAEEMSQADVPLAAAQPVMSMDDYASHEESIAAAVDMSALQKAFAAAYTVARDTRDQSAMKAFMELKDKRKKELA